MQAAIVRHGRIGRENRRLYGRAIAVEAPAIKRNAADVFQIEINCIGCNRVQNRLKGFLNVNSSSPITLMSLLTATLFNKPRGLDDQTNVFVKLDVRRQRQLHCFSLMLHCLRNSASAVRSGR